MDVRVRVTLQWLPLRVRDGEDGGGEGENGKLADRCHCELYMRWFTDRSKRSRVGVDSCSTTRLPGQIAAND